MILYLVPTPENKLDLKGRETGWHRVPLDRTAKKAFRERLKQLSDKGVQYVLGSDLDTEAVNVAANELHVPPRTVFELRRFNIGKYHGGPSSDIDPLLGTILERWKHNPTMPFKCGDSLISYQKRLISFVRQKLTEKGTAALVTDLRTIRALGTLKDEFDPKSFIGNGIHRDRIYVLKGE